MLDNYFQKFEELISPRNFSVQNVKTIPAINQKHAKNIERDELCEENSKFEDVLKKYNECENISSAQLLYNDNNTENNNSHNTS